MTLGINIITAWISVGLILLLSIIYLLRIINKGTYKNKLIGKINKKLRKIHRPLGICFLIFGCIHGYFSSEKLISLNFGTLGIIIGVLLGLNYLLRKPLKGHGSWIKIHRYLTVLLIVTVGLHLWQVGGIMGPKAFFAGVTREMESSVEKIYGFPSPKTDNQSNVQPESSPQVDQGKNDVIPEKANLFLGNVDLKDGTYQGSAQGYGPDLRVSVTVENNVVTEVMVISHNEKNEKYYGRAIDAVPSEIVAAQNPEVDIVSGATYTSIGIMRAVNDALSQAVVSGTLPQI
ncbi:MAG: FMN-binding protein [Eubacteriaceae bacterium]